MYPVNNIDLKAEKLMKDWRSIVGVKQMGTCKIVITFSSKEEMDDILAMG